MPIRLALLGDSIAHGKGAEDRSRTLGVRLPVLLAEHGYDAAGKVFAKRGAGSSDLARQVAAAREWQPDLAVVVVGANDLRHRVPPGEAARALGAAVRELRLAGVLVVVAPAPDLSVVPGVPVLLAAAVRAASRRLRVLQVEATEAAGGRVADVEGLTSARFAADPRLFSPDRFHPSGDGYAVIADALVPALLAALAASVDDEGTA